MNKDLKKLIATAIATGTLVSGGFIASNKANCDYTIKYKGENICISKEVKQSIESQLKPNSGFGGVRFGQ